MDSTYIQICIGHFREQVSVRAEPGTVSVGMGELRCLLSSGPAATRAELSRAAGRCAQTQLAPRDSPATPSSEKHFSISTQLCCQGGASSSIPASYMPAPPQHRHPGFNPKPQNATVTCNQTTCRKRPVQTCPSSLIVLHAHGPESQTDPTPTISSLWN